MKLIWTLVATLCALVGLGLTAKAVYSDYQLYQSESECVKKYIQSGVERRDIITYNGTCRIKG